MPELQALQPMSTSQVLDRTFSLYRHNFLLFAGIAAFPPALVLAGQLLVLVLAKPFVLFGRAPVGVASPAGIDQSIMGAVTVALGSIVIFVLWLVGFTMAVGASMHAVSRVHLGHPAGIGESYRLIRSHIGSILGIVIIVFVCISAVMALGTGFFVIPIVLKASRFGLGDPTASVAFILLGVLVFLAAAVCGFFLFAKFFLTVPACVIEKLGVIDSLKRSWSLTSGSAGRLMLVIVLWAVIDLAISGILSIPYLVGIAMVVSKRDPSLLLPFVIWQYVASFLSRTLANPIASISAALIYYDQRVRKEAFDLQLMIDAIGPPSPPATATAAYPSAG